MLRLPIANAPIPAETARVAKAIFPEGNGIMRIRDALGAIFQTADFAPLFPALGQPALDPARIALAEWACRASDRLDQARMPRSRHCL